MTVIKRTVFIFPGKKAPAAAAAPRPLHRAREQGSRRPTYFCFVSFPRKNVNSTVRCISSWPFSGPESGPCFGAAGEPQNMTRRRRRVILSNIIGSRLPQHTGPTLRVNRPASFRDPSQKPGALWLKLRRIWLKLGSCILFPNLSLAFFRQVLYGWAVIAPPRAV